jgi:hypothetical protein
MNAVLLILQGLNTVVATLPATLETALALQKIFAAAGEDFTTQIQVFEDGALRSASETVDIIDRWKRANGFA